MAAKPSTKKDAALAGEIAEFRDKIKTTIAERIHGNEDIIDGLLTAILCGGHALLIGVPGLGKTLLIKSLCDLLGLDFSRIQFTPDLMPADITGSEVLEETKTGRKFKFVKGPVFANIILADEINRTPPRTQSALLQAMEEKQVTVGSSHYDLDPPFFVMATQNPIEQEGTYPLPEAQLDRFLLSLHLEYPDHNQELAIAVMDTARNNDLLKPVTNKKTILTYQDLVARVPIAPELVEKIVAMVRRTRAESQNGLIEYGAGPRASQAIVRAARARALLLGEFAVSEEHIQHVTKPVLRHRIILSYNALAEGLDVDQVLNEFI